MTAALEGSEWSAARPGRTLLPGKTRYPFYRRLCGPPGRYGRAENLVHIGIWSRTVQPVAQSLYRLSYRVTSRKVNYGAGGLRAYCWPLVRCRRLSLDTCAAVTKRYFLRIAMLSEGVVLDGVSTCLRGTHCCKPASLDNLMTVEAGKGHSDVLVCMGKRSTLATFLCLVKRLFLITWIHLWTSFKIVIKKSVNNDRTVAAEVHKCVKCINYIIIIIIHCGKKQKTVKSQCVPIGI